MLKDLSFKPVRLQLEARSEQEEQCIDDLLLGETDEDLRDDLESLDSSPSDLKQCRSMSNH